MDGANTTTSQANLPFSTICAATLEKASTYTIQGKTFIVSPVFQKAGSETLATVLLKLMQSDSTAN